MQRKRNEGGGWQAAGWRFCSETAPSIAKTVAPIAKTAPPTTEPSRPQRKASQHSTFIVKIAIFIECCDGLKAPTTTKVPVPFVVVLDNVLCRGLGLAALADRVDHDVQQQQHNGHDHDKHGKLALAPVAASQRLLLVDILLVVLGAHAMHQ